MQSAVFFNIICRCRTRVDFTDHPRRSMGAATISHIWEYQTNFSRLRFFFHTKTFASPSSYIFNYDRRILLITRSILIYSSRPIAYVDKCFCDLLSFDIKDLGVFFPVCLFYFMNTRDFFLSVGFNYLTAESICDFGFVLQENAIKNPTFERLEREILGIHTQGPWGNKRGDIITLLFHIHPL